MTDSKETVGIDWRTDEQVVLLSELGQLSPFDLPDGLTGNLHDYHVGNEFFVRLDAWVLQAMLRHLRPRRMIEVGCGWSSLLSARVNRECLDRSMNLVCVDTNPWADLAGVDGISEVITGPVQDSVSLGRFLGLRENDVLFIDSSHVAQTDSDVVFLCEEVLPRLAPGVVVHFHDIFLPWDYPQIFVTQGRGYNEQYLVRAFLSFNQSFQIMLGVCWLIRNRPEALAEIVPDYLEKCADGGASLWIKRV